MIIILKECPTHGLCEHRQELRKGRKKRRDVCLKCRKITDTTNREKKNYFKSLGREYLGAKCSIPNCNHNCPTHLLQFDHLPGFIKICEVTKMIDSVAFTHKGSGYTPEEVWEEIKKCRLLCPIHHLLLTTKYTHEDLMNRYDIPELYESYNISSLEDCFD